MTHTTAARTPGRDEDMGLSYGAATALKAHRGHYVIEDVGAEMAAETVLWCEDCALTVWYLESDSAPM